MPADRLDLLDLVFNLDTNLLFFAFRLIAVAVLIATCIKVPIIEPRKHNRSTIPVQSKIISHLCYDSIKNIKNNNDNNDNNNNTNRNNNNNNNDDDDNPKLYITQNQKSYYLLTSELCI